MTIQAIETDYAGYRFRSRLEARWAVVFTQLGIRYEYEKDGYSLPPISDSFPETAGMTLQYLPDFFIPAQARFPEEIWVEVKPPGGIDRLAMEKLSRLAKYSGIDGVFCSEVPDPRCGLFPDNPDDAMRMFGGMGQDFAHWLCQCSSCGSIGFQFEGRSNRIKCQCGHRGDEYTAMCDDLKAAYSAARRERFGT